MFIAGSGAVTLNPDRLQRVVPPNQSFSGDDYAGKNELLGYLADHATVFLFVLLKESFIFAFGCTANGTTS